MKERFAGETPGMCLAPQLRFAEERGLQAASLCAISQDVAFPERPVSVPRGSDVNVALRPLSHRRR